MLFAGTTQKKDTMKKHVNKSTKVTTSKSSKSSLDGMPQGIPIVVDVDNVTTPPRLVHKVKVTYPSKALKKGIEGKVIVDALIDTTGKVEKATVVKSTNKIFNEPAIKAVKEYKFTPARKGKKKVKVHVKIPVMFRIEKNHTNTGVKNKK